MENQPNQPAAETSNPSGSPEEKLNIMAQNAKAETSAGGFMNPGAKRRGRRPGSKNQARSGPGVAGGTSGPGPMAGGTPQPHVDPIAELMPVTKGLATFYSNFLVQIAEDERAKLTEEKHAVISHTAAVCLNQYFPGVLGAHAALIVLSVTVLETGMSAMRFRNENLEKLREEKKNKYSQPEEKVA